MFIMGFITLLCLLNFRLCLDDLPCAQMGEGVGGGIPLRRWELFILFWGTKTRFLVRYKVLPQL